MSIPVSSGYRMHKGGLYTVPVGATAHTGVSLGVVGSNKGVYPRGGLDQGDRDGRLNMVSW